MTERNLRRELGQHLTGMDNMCFQLEHPGRLMTICSIWTFSARLDTTLVMAALENLCAHYPRFCLVPKHGSLWETSLWTRPQRHWKFKNNVIFHTLENSTLTCLQHYVANQYVKPFDHDKPLWEVHLISGLENKQFAFLWKVHHSMSDSVGIIKAVLATTTSMDPKEEMYRQWKQQQNQTDNGQQRQQQYKSNRHTSDRRRRSYQHLIARQKCQQLQYETAKRKFGILWQQVMIWFLWGWSLVGIVTNQVRYELWTIGLLVELWLYQLKRLFLLPMLLLYDKQQQQQQPTRAWSYDDEQTLEKLMAWTDDLDWGDIQNAQGILGDPKGVTLDDVILLVLGRTMRRYSSQQQHLDIGTFRILVPVSFRHPMDWTMKNATTGSLLELQTGNRHTLTIGALLDMIHQQRMTIQRSAIPYVIHHIIIERILRYFPFLMVPLWIQQWYADLPHATVTSVVGPTTPVFFGGQEMKECHILHPQCGKGTISVGVVTYGDKINLSILTDNHPAYPDLANSLCKIFVSEFNAVVDEAMVTVDGYSDEGIIM